MSFISVRRYTILAISALIGLLIALGLLYLVNRAAAVDTVPVVVATRAITTGTTLDESMLTVQQWPAHLKPFVAASNIDSVIGQLTREDLESGEPLLPGKLFLAGESGSLSDRLTRGDRGLSIVVNEMVGVDPKTLVVTELEIFVTTLRFRNWCNKFSAAPLVNDIKRGLPRLIKLPMFVWVVVWRV